MRPIEIVIIKYENDWNKAKKMMVIKPRRNSGNEVEENSGNKIKSADFYK